jgi:hypothetical protein
MSFLVIFDLLLPIIRCRMIVCVSKYCVYRLHGQCHKCFFTTVSGLSQHLVQTILTTHLLKLKLRAKALGSDTTACPLSALLVIVLTCP